MSLIAINDITVDGNYGVSEAERAKRQPIVVSVSLIVDTSDAEKSDNVEHTVSWSDIRKKIVAVIEQNSYRLMERLADEIINKLIEDNRIHQVTLKLEKPEAFDSGVPSLTVVRTRT